MWQAWFQFLTTLGLTIMKENGNAPREMAYLEVLSKGAALLQSGDLQLQALVDKYQQEVAAGTVTTADELRAVVKRIEERGEEIQSA